RRIRPRPPRLPRPRPR
nr:Chain C, Cathelicidin-3 [Bos taurus]4JWC_D Chain D, Cathelicidin-3 [Bos taurus]5F8K_1y Chain 1y, Cathelicidin-3 [Bos taurus]5F8K_2y Chain 2y, Cathelicidin-3 [Bos taurus]